MFSFLGKKKISENILADYFVEICLESSEVGFAELCEVIKMDPVFIEKPSLNANQYDRFLLIVVAGNLKMLPAQFDAVTTRNIESLVFSKLALVFDLEPAALKKIIADLQGLMDRLNHPSKNIPLAMAKTICAKYNLNAYQDEYFRQMNVPNPVFLKRLQEVTREYIFNWDVFLEKYKVAT
ncbi:MAG: hypothetical protein ACXITV_02540 [Luteibaculaceae bacterium]